MHSWRASIVIHVIQLNFKKEGAINFAPVKIYFLNNLIITYFLAIYRKVVKQALADTAIYNYNITRKRL